MTNYLIEIALCIILSTVFFFASPVLFITGKFLLKAMTLNKYPPQNLTPKQKQNIIDTGLIFFFIIIAVTFFIRNN